MRKNSFIQGALILTVAGIIVKFIGAFSRIYLSRLLGGEGIGLYQMAYPIICCAFPSHRQDFPWPFPSWWRKETR